MRRSVSERRPRRKPSILVIQQYFYPDISAVSQLLTELLVHLSQDSDYEFSVLCTGVARPPGRRLTGRIGNVKILHVPVPRFRRSFTLISVVQTALFHAAVFLYLGLSRRHDVVISMTSPPLVGFTVAMALHWRNERFVYYIEDLYPELLFDSRVITKSFIVKKLSLFNRVTLRRADRTITIGEYMARKLYLNYGIPKASVAVIPNWAPTMRFVPPRTTGSLKLLYSGNLGFGHDLRLLVDLVESLKDMEVEYRFVGAGRRFNEAKKLFESAGETRVSFDGYVELSEHAEVLSDANVLIVAQAWRTLGDLVPSKFYSYLAAGRPILFFGPVRSEIGETIEKLELGATVELARDVEGAAGLLRRYATDANYYAEVCRRARETYESRYGLERSAADLRAILDDLIECEAAGS